MADINIIPGLQEDIDKTPDAMLADLPEKVIKHGKHAVASVLAGLAISIAAPVGAQTAPVSSSPSVSLQETKWGWQVVKIDGIEYTFSRIATLPRDQRSAIVKKMEELNPDTLEDYNDYYLQAANQRKTNEANWEQAANQEADQAAIRKEAAINDIIQRIPQIIPIYESKISVWQKLSTDQQKTLEYILSLGKPPEWMPRIQKLLANKQNFA